MPDTPKIHHWKHGWIPLDAVALASRQGKALDMPDYDGMSPTLKGKINAKLTDLTGMSEPELAAKVQDNLKRLYAAGDASQADWYSREGRDIAARAAQIRAEYPDSPVDQERLTGMIALTSAQKRWAENKDFAEAIARKLAEDKPFKVSKTMIADYNAWATKRRAGTALPHPDLAPGTYRPSELPADFAASKTPKMPKHLNADYVIQSVRVYRGELTVDQAVQGPKQRSFVNNLMDPADKRFVTVDTWHYKAAMQGIPVKKKVGDTTFAYTLDEWDSRDIARADGRAVGNGYDPAKPFENPKNLAATIRATKTPQDFFQGGPSSVKDGYRSSFGVYPWFVKQTQVAADKLGVSPNALQSVAWYAVGGGQ